MGIDAGSVNWLAVAAAAAAAWLLGGVWYGALFAKAWTRANAHGPDALEAMRREQGRALLVFLAVELVSAAAVALLLSGMAAPTAMSGAAVGGLLGAGVVAANGFAKTTANRRAPESWLIDAGHAVVTLSAVGAILGAWR